MKIKMRILDRIEMRIKAEYQVKSNLGYMLVLSGFFFFLGLIFLFIAGVANTSYVPSIVSFLIGTIFFIIYLIVWAGYISNKPGNKKGKIDPYFSHLNPPSSQKWLPSSKRERNKFERFRGL